MMEMHRVARSREVLAGFEGYKNTLKNRLYKILCLYEENEDWKKYIRSLQIEIKGLEEELCSINYWSLRAKVNELRWISKEPDDFRATVFECMQLVGGLPNEPNTIFESLS